MYGRDQEKAIKEVKKVSNKDEVIKGVSNYLNLIHNIQKLFTE